MCILSFNLSAAKFSASLDKDTATLEDTVELTLKFENAEPRGQPSLPPLDGLRVLGQNRSQQFSSVNGQTSQSLSFIFTLKPTREGVISIPPLQVEVDGQRLASQPLKLTVTKATPAPAGENGAPQPAFLKLIVPRNEIFVGEVLPAELRLYFQEARIQALPQLATEGFTIGTMPQNPEQTVTQMNGTRYNLFVFRFPITAVKAGTLTLGPATAPITLMVGYRGTDFFGRRLFTEERQATLSSEPQTMIVHELPKDNVPATFNGAVGKFNLHVEASPTNLTVGDPITVRIQISGQGALDSLTLPSQPAWREFKTYTPSSKINPTDALGLEGSKTFEEVVSPQNADIKELPGFEFSFFDPEQKTYRTINTPPIPLTVHPTAATPQPTVVSAAPPTNEAPTSPKEIVHIEPQSGTLRAPDVALLRRPGFIALQALAPLLWIGSILFRKQKEKVANNPKLRRRREVERVVREGLKQLGEQAAANKSEDFFATTFRLLQEQLGEKLDLPASAITEAVVDEQLKPKGIKAETISLLHELFQTCNQARYAPQRSRQQLAAYIPKVETALAELQKI